MLFDPSGSDQSPSGARFNQRTSGSQTKVFTPQKHGSLDFERFACAGFSERLELVLYDPVLAIQTSQISGRAASIVRNRLGAYLYPEMKLLLSCRSRFLVSATRLGIA